MSLGKIICGDALNELRKLSDESIDCVITSPPYWGLRDYGVDGQLGLEKTPEEYVKKMVEIFREIRRVLADHGTLWLNIGDSYAAAKYGSGGGWQTAPAEYEKSPSGGRSLFKDPGYKHGVKNKDLVGIPWMLAFALRADGWYLRQDIIWSKPNPMPESVTDRCTKAHEYVFMLSKSARYYYDANAIKTTAAESSRIRLAQNIESQKGSTRVPGKTNGPMKAVMEDQKNIRHARDKQRGHSRRHAGFNDRWDELSKEEQMMQANKRSVWTVPTMPFKEAHFATFPEKLIEPMVMAGTPPQWRRTRSIHGCGDHRARGKETRATVHRHRTQPCIHQDRGEAVAQYPRPTILI